MSIARPVKFEARDPAPAAAVTPGKTSIWIPWLARAPTRKVARFWPNKRNGVGRIVTRANRHERA